MTLIEIIYAFICFTLIFAVLSIILFSVIFTMQLILFFKLNKFEMYQKQLAQELTQVKDRVAKIGTETTFLKDRVDDLEIELLNAGVVQEPVLEALEALKEQTRIVDELVEDQTETT